ncbi:hypothetical protein IKD57_00970 [Candidatus Saccharibacteria bacterium]|nr:hypothetical protein [Candidatus Saccharibacteria bacterium]
MKKQKLILPMLAPAMILAGGLLANNTYATETGMRIEAKKAGVVTCEIYQNGDGSFIHIFDPCDASFGSYDSDSSTLTLGAGIEGYSLQILGVYSDGNVTLKSTEGVNLDGILTDRDLVYDNAGKTITTTGLGSFGETLNDDGNLIVEAGTLTIESDNNSSTSFEDVIINDGVLNIGGGFINASSITLNGGELNATRTIYTDDLTVNGGDLTMQDDTIGIANKIEIKDGSITAKSTGENIGITFRKNNASYVQTGGAVEIEGNGGTMQDGIRGFMTGSNTITISDGTLTIKNVSEGINLKNNSVINFNGGTTKIEKTKTHAIWIQGPEAPKDAIRFAEGVGIKEEGISVFWDNGDYATESQAGIYAPEVVTITSGYDHDEEEGAPDIPSDVTPSDDEDSKKSDVKVPDTGASTNSEKGGALSIFAASTFILLSVIALATAHKKHASGHFKYDE